MTDVDKVFSGSIPELYDRYLVPLIFTGYADDLAARVAANMPKDVLETAAGTGVVTRALASRLPASARITATDLNQPMLDRAASQLASERVTWKHADAMALPFADASVDAVACQFGAMFFPDKVTSYKEARRVLKHGGRFFFSVWGKISDNEFADVVTQELAALFPQDPPRFLARTPHGFHDVGTIRDDLKAAGFSDVSVDTVDLRSRAPSPLEPAIAYCQGTPLRSEIEARDATGLDAATKRATEAIAQRFGRGAVDGRISAHVVSAVR
jgi:ubiquinone/menaquinone biosynthesis C-methylase UbiE